MKYLCSHQRATLGRVTCQCTEPVMTSQSTELLTTPPSQLWREGENILNSSVLKYYIYTILLFSIPGVPGEDYPIYAEVPETAFSCSGQVDGGESEYFLHLKYFHYWVWNISHSDGESLSLSEYFYFVAKNVSCTQYRVQCNGQLGHSMVGNQGGQGVSTDVSQYTCEKVKALVRIPILIRF